MEKPTLPDAVRGHGLCISFLLDPRLRHWTVADSASTCSSPSTANCPSLHSLKNTVLAFKESLAVSDEKSEKLSVKPGINEISLFAFLFDSFVSHLLSLVQSYTVRLTPRQIVLCSV